MNIKNLSFFAAIIIVTFPFAESKESQKNKWKGTISNENGIEVIKNPTVPLYGDIKFNLKEDLSIGQENDNRYMFYRIIDVKVDADENIYVMDIGNKRIQKYDRFGKYLCTIGREGQGPGEFQSPLSFDIDDNQGIVGVLDGRKLKLFDKKGKYLNKDITFDHFNEKIVLDTGGNIWGIGSENEDSDNGQMNVYKVLSRYTTEGKIDKKISRIQYDIFTTRTEQGTVSVVLTEEYDLLICPLNGPGLVNGYSKEYKINLIDSEGSSLKTIIKEEPYNQFTPDEKKKAGKAAKFPEHRPFFYLLFPDSKGRIYVRRNNLRPFEDGERRFDIFSKDGYFLYTSTFSSNPFLIKNGFLYTQIINNDSGEIKVKRLKIKNWDQIKENIF